jgi:acyl carrier protein
MNLPNRPDATTSPERLEIAELFRSLASQVARKEFGNEVTETSVISELGLDSIHNLEIIGEMERKLAIQIPNDDLEDLTTVADLLDVVEKAQKSGA